MLYSQLFGKTTKKTSAEASTISHKLLYQAGYIRESTAGRYYFLPLGIKVQQKIIKIIKEEMDKADAQEMITPVLHPLSLWQETNRDKSTGYELMKVEDRHGAKFALGGTAEEMFVDIIRKFQLSYKDLPLNLYQFSTKFRDELRARGGLLRVREFMMKDSYSFDVDEKEFKKVYQKMWNTYKKIFLRLGLETVAVESDNGYIGGDYCHEFVVLSDAGESNFYISDDGQRAVHEDLVNKLTPDEKKNMKLKKGIEVGNIFQLGYYYSKKMLNAVFKDKDGKDKPFYMGCYGIGIGRTMATMVEVSHDDRGIIWPDSASPYQIHLVGLNLNEDKVKTQTEKIYKQLVNNNIDVLYDDREVSPGEKFAVADLIGIPVRLVISQKTGDKIEFKRRKENNSKIVSVDELFKITVP